MNKINKPEKYRILVVDDDKQYLDDMYLFLEGEFQVELADNTRSAQEIVMDFKPHCILLDIELPVFISDDPKREGIEFLKKIKRVVEPQLDLSISTIIISTSPNRKTVSEVLCLGADETFRKPVNIQQLKKIIYKLTKERRIEYEKKKT